MVHETAECTLFHSSGSHPMELRNQNKENNKLRCILSFPLITSQTEDGKTKKLMQKKEGTERSKKGLATDRKNIETHRRRRVFGALKPNKGVET